MSALQPKSSTDLGIYLSVEINIDHSKGPSLTGTTSKSKSRPRSNGSKGLTPHIPEFLNRCCITGYQFSVLTWKWFISDPSKLNYDYLVSFCPRRPHPNYMYCK